MAYCTKADLIARGWEDELISLTDKQNLLGGIIDDVALAQAISDASAEIDSYLVTHIALPIVNPSDFLVRKACDMVRFYLYDVGAIEAVVKRYKAAIEFLSGIATGATALSALTTITAPSNDLIQKPVVKSSAVVFSDDLLGKM